MVVTRFAGYFGNVETPSRDVNTRFSFRIFSDPQPTNSKKKQKTPKSQVASINFERETVSTVPASKFRPLQW